MKFEKIIISGGWAYGNVGDEAILKYTLEDISKTFPNTSITVLSYDPVVTLKEFNVDCKLCLHAIAEKNKQKNTNYLYNVIDNNYRKDALLEEYTNMFNEKTLFIMSGGGYFNDIWVESFLAHICEIKIAKMKNSKIVIMGQTIGPIEKSKHKKLFKKYITQCDYIAVRDRTSQSFLRDSFNVEARLFPDVVNRVPLPTSKDFKNIKRIAIMYQKLRPYTYEETSLLKYRIEQIKNILFRKNIKFDSSFIEFINYIMDNYPNIKLEFVLSTEWHIERVEKLISKTNMKKINIIHGLTAQQLIDKIFEYDLVITANMHPAIIAISQGIPAIAISHTYKIDDYMSSISLESLCKSVDEIDKYSLIEIFKNIEYSTCIEKIKVISLKQKKSLDNMYEELKNAFNS